MQKAHNFTPQSTYHDQYSFRRLRAYLREAMERMINNEPLELNKLREVFDQAQPQIPHFPSQHRRVRLTEIQV